MSRSFQSKYHEQKGPLGREDNVTMGHRGVDWIHLAQNGDQWRAVVNTFMYLGVPQKTDNFLTE
jgi:hypothetical protein